MVEDCYRGRIMFIVTLKYLFTKGRSPSLCLVRRPRVDPRCLHLLNGEVAGGGLPGDTYITVTTNFHCLLNVSKLIRGWVKTSKRSIIIFSLFSEHNKEGGHKKGWGVGGGPLLDRGKSTGKS